MRGCSLSRCRVCLGPGIIYPVSSLVLIPTGFAINSSILAGAGLTSSTSGRAWVSPTGWSCPGQHSRTAGTATHHSRMQLGGGCGSHTASPNPTFPVLPYPKLPQSMDELMEQVFLPAWSIIPQHHPCAMGSNPVPSEPSWHGTCLLLAPCKCHYGPLALKLISGA